MENGKRRTFTAWLPLVSRVLTVLAAGAAYAILRSTTIETDLIARYFHDPAAGQISRAIGASRILNHLDLLVLTQVLSVVFWVLARRVATSLVSAVLLAVLPAVLMFLLSPALLQPLPVRYLAFFLAGGVLLVGMSVAVYRADREAPGASLSGTARVYAVVPFVSELITPRFAWRRVYGFPSARTGRGETVDRLLSSVTPAWTLLVLGSLLSYGTAIGAINTGRLPDLIKGRRAERIVLGDYHGLELDRARGRLLATNMSLVRLEAFALDGVPARVYERQFPVKELENIRINPARNELYHFDRGSRKLQVFDAGDWSLKRESTAPLGGGGTAQVEFDNESATILVTRESDYVWLFDMDTLNVIHEHDEHGGGNADVLFSTVLKQYVLSYYSYSTVFRTLTPRTGQYAAFGTLPYENDLQESVRRRELYIAVPLESAVYVYDLDDLNRRRRILRTMFGVRGMAYDNANDLLLTVSMVSGYLDVLRVETGEIVNRLFVGYYLREIVLNEQTREAFVSSQIGGVYRVRY